ncbi:MAG: asparagine synthase (glutamine-hydrolyzing) [Bacteroidetes bacterium]|nr:asparagine synthase (glutamine-hydrolyzing) [Bacteroidota bacterium]
MCGIAGILRFDQQPASEQVIRAMTRALQHRGPDAEGIFTKGCLALGHRRLSILDTSVASNQPFEDPTGRYQMVYNGELYNFRDLRRKIPDYHFQTTGDTEVLLQWFIRSGKTGLDTLAGMFAFAVWDAAAQSLCLVRDRLGVKPLYYYLDEQQLVFASEIRAILAGGWVKPAIATGALHDYFRYQSVSCPDTMIKGIRQVPPGHLLRIHNGKASLESWWDINRKPSVFAPDNERQVQQDILDLLTQSVERRMVSDVPVGAFLSGGIDSSAVVGLMRRVSGQRPNTFTIAFKEKEYDESAYAAIAARKFNTNHQVIELGAGDLLGSLGDALNAMDSPSGDGVNTYVVSKAVKAQGISVALTGAGGDELFAGYPFFQQYMRLRNRSLVWDHSSPVRKLVGKTMVLRPHSKYRDLLNTPSTSIADLYPVFRQIMAPALIAELVRAPSVDRIAGQLDAWRRPLEDFPLYSQVSIAELTGYTRNTLMLDLDQMSMAHALEVREPFFDHDLVQYVLQVPDKIKSPSYPKRLLVESLAGLLPDELVFRQKKGFLFPWKDWLRKDLRAFCQRRIESMAARSFIDGAALLSLWADYLRGDQQVKWVDVWLFVVLEHWLERNGVGC